jgi:Amt family ammonium transporter
VERHFFLIDVDDYAYWLFQYAFPPPQLPSLRNARGTPSNGSVFVSHYCQGYLSHCRARHLNPNGFLSAHSVDPLWGHGMVDFVVPVSHQTGGTTAPFATMILGPIGRFIDETGRKLENQGTFPGHSIAFAGT